MAQKGPAVLIVTRDGVKTEQELVWEEEYDTTIGKCPHCLAPYPHYLAPYLVRGLLDGMWMRCTKCEGVFLHRPKAPSPCGST